MKKPQIVNIETHTKNAWLLRLSSVFFWLGHGKLKVMSPSGDLHHFVSDGKGNFNLPFNLPSWTEGNFNLPSSDSKEISIYLYRITIYLRTIKEFSIYLYRTVKKLQFTFGQYRIFQFTCNRIVRAWEIENHVTVRRKFRFTFIGK